MSAVGAVPHQIKGPSATGTDLRRLWQLTWTLAVTDFKLRFFGSVLGYAWTLMRPLLLFGVLLVLFTKILDVTGSVVLYPQALLLGMMFFHFFAEVTSQSVRSLLDRENLVRRIDFPRLAIPLSIVLQALFNLALSMIVVLGFLLAAGGEVRWSWLQLFPLIGLLALFATGLAMLLSILFVRYRDVAPIWEVTLQSLFYLSPVFFTVELVAARFNEEAVRYLLFNPFAAILQQARHAVIDPSHPSTADAMGGAGWLLVPLAIGLVILLGGAQLFRKRAPGVAEEL
jgi:ABC-2 type transport system permease protein